MSVGTCDEVSDEQRTVPLTSVGCHQERRLLLEGKAHSLKLANREGKPTSLRP